MAISDAEEITALLDRWRAGDKEAGNQVLAIAYDELHAIARREFRRERQGHTLQPTALAHEAFLRLAERGGVEANDRTHFLALAARVVRQVLVDHSRRRDRLKRGAGQFHVTLEDDILDSGRAPSLVDLDEALERLSEINPQAAHLVELRFFGGLKVDETAAQLGVSVATAIRLWQFARTWLYGEILPDAE